MLVAAVHSCLLNLSLLSYYFWCQIHITYCTYIVPVLDSLFPVKCFYLCVFLFRSFFTTCKLGIGFLCGRCIFLSDWATWFLLAWGPGGVWPSSVGLFSTALSPISMVLSRRLSMLQCCATVYSHLSSVQPCADLLVLCA